MDSPFVRQVISDSSHLISLTISPLRSVFKRPMRLFFVLFLLLTLVFSPLGGLIYPAKKISAAANNDPTAYPYKDGPTCATGTCTPDAWSFIQRECTSYVAWKINANHNSSVSPYFFRNIMFGSNDDVKFGHGGHWDDALANALANGANTWFYVDKVPSVGAAAIWNPYSTTGGARGIIEYGHVAYVESVNANGTINVSEYNYAGNGNYGTRPNTMADQYIHFNSPEIGPMGGLNGNVYNSSSLINFNSTLITATVTSTGINNSNFYYQKSYLGSYNLALPSGFVTLTATDGTNTFTIKNLYIPAYSSKLYNITLNNQCIDGSTGNATSCSSPPFIASANSGGGTISGGVTGTGTTCTTAPATTSSVTGVTQGNNGWWRSATTVSFYASAPCGLSGLKTYYSINGGASQLYSGPFNLTQEGIYNITFYSVDGLGNTEGNKSVQVKMDLTAPVTTGTASGPRDTNGIFRDTVTAGLNATDNLSGIDYEQYSMDGGTTWTNKTGANNTFLITGNGVSRFVYRSTDLAGNTEQQKDSGPIIINKYVIFTNGTSNSLRFLYTSGVNISGDIYSKGTATIRYNTGSTFGTSLSTVGTANVIDSTNTNIQTPTIITGAASVPMLSYPLSLYQSLATVVFPSDLYMDSVSSSLKGIIYVQGNVKMTDVALSGPVSIVATGTITDYTTDSSFQTGDPNNGVLLYAGQNIDINSTGNRNLGLLYAPNGIIYIRSTNLNLKGSLVGNQVELNGATGFTLSYSAAFSSATYTLPLTAMGLTIPSSPLPALPAVPILSKPNNSATGVSTSKPKLTWDQSSGAIGFQVQVSKLQDFSTLIYNGSQFSTIANMTLQSSTKYYWRVRSINQAGMSAWSSVRSFTTQ